MNMRTIGIAVIVVALVAAMVSATPDGAGVSEQSTSTWAAQTAGTDTAIGGYISGIELTIGQSTTKWQGYMGSIADSVVLADSAGKKMYDWGSATTLTGEVFATTNPSAPNWANVVAVDATARDDATNGIDAKWGFTSTDKDSAKLTFTNVANTVTVASSTASNTVATEDNAILPTGNGWRTLVIADGTISAKNNYIFVGEIHSDGTGYDSSSVDYQMIVPAGADDTYYFYVEVG